MVDSFQRSATYYDTKERSLAVPQSLTAPNAAQSSRERRRETAIWHTINAQSSADRQKGSEGIMVNVEITGISSRNESALSLYPGSNCCAYICSNGFSMSNDFYCCVNQAHALNITDTLQSSISQEISDMLVPAFADRARLCDGASKVRRQS